MKSIRRKAWIAGAAPLALALSGCMGGGAVPSASTPITTSEAQQGAEYHPQFLAQFGGAMQGSQAQYVEQIGKNIAVQSGLGNARGYADVACSLRASIIAGVRAKGRAARQPAC